jgi:hypothetical protein
MPASRRRLAIIGGIGLAAVAAGCALARAPCPVVRDAAMARQAVVDALRKGSEVERQAAERDDVQQVPTQGVPIEDWYVFAARLREEGPEPPVRERLYVVWPRTPLDGRTVALEPQPHLFVALMCQRKRVPKSAEEAVEVATCYAWLASHVRPEKLKVLESGEVPDAWHGSEHAEALRQEIEGPKVVKRTWAPRGYSVTFCACASGAWGGDIHRWHFLIGERTFEVHRYPIVLAPRGYE